MFLESRSKWLNSGIAVWIKRIKYVLKTNFFSSKFQTRFGDLGVAATDVRLVVDRREPEEVPDAARKDGQRWKEEPPGSNNILNTFIQTLLDIVI